MIEIAHLSQSASTLGGGIPEAIRALMRAQQARGDVPRMVSVADAGGSLGEWPGGEPVWLKGQRGPGMLRLPGIGGVLDGLKPELTHTHGLWTWLSVGVPRWARANGKPYLVSPHGMLDGWALANSRWKKVLAGAAFERRHLAGAACLHALCRSEAEAIRGYGLRNPVCVIPNGIELPSDDETFSVSSFQFSGGRKILLFLGRLHPKKGLVNALRAWHSNQQSTIRDPRSAEWQFVIAGWGQGGHQEELMRLCDELGLVHREVTAAEFVEANQSSLESSVSKSSVFDSSVLFLGPVFGETKDRLLRMADAFILPSFSEGLPMSVLEAWAYRLPVLMTDHCNLPEGFDAGAAIRIGTDEQGIAAGMRELFGSSISDLQSLGRNGRDLVERQFTWKTIAERMAEVYQWVLGEGERPVCVLGGD